METLFIVHQICGGVSLHDSGGHHIGTFQSAQEAISWCKEFGYNVRFES